MSAILDTTREDAEREALLAPWRDRPLPELIEHLLTRYHRTLERDLELIRDLMDQSRARHAHWGAETILELRRTLSALSDELLGHMLKEERILFPWILGGNGYTAGPPIAVMQQDHKRASSMVNRLATLTQGFRCPPGACNTWCRLVLKLAEVAKDLEDHMALEDHILFPRALAGA